MQNGRSHLIHDWNQGGGLPPGRKRPLVNDESLRDGLQSPSVRHPTPDEMVEILLAVEATGIDACNIGLPGAGPHVVATAKRLATEIRDRKLKVKPNCAARTVVADIEPIRRIIDEVGIPIEVAMFIGSSPIRLEVEGWDVDRLLKTSEVALQYCLDHKLPAMYVTEDTTRADPETVRRLYGLALDMGAQRLVVCDTCGHATPDGVRRLVQFVRQVAVDHKQPHVQIDWHGHNDRGLALINSIAAYEAGRRPPPRDRAGDRRARRQLRDGPAPREPAPARLVARGPPAHRAARLRGEGRRGLPYAGPVQLPRRRARRLRDRHRRPRRGRDQGAQARRPLAGEPRLLRRAGRRLRLRAADRRRARCRASRT